MDSKGKLFTDRKLENSLRGKEEIPSYYADLFSYEHEEESDY